MLTNNQLEKYADVLIWGLNKARSSKFKKNDVILIRYDAEATSLLEPLYRKLIGSGFNVVLRGLSTPVIEKDFYEYSNQGQRKFVANGEREFYTALNGNIYLSAPSSITHLKGIDPKKIAETAISRKFIREILEKREEAGAFGWTLCTLPTEALAKQAGLSLKEYSAQVVKACFLNDKDPVATWQGIFDQAKEIKAWLNKLDINTIQLQSANMDLSISYGDKRKFIGVSGHNIPSFELFTSPDWRGTEGVYYADFPSYRSGNLVKNVRLEFKKGRVVNATATEGEDFVKKMVAMDRGAAQIGEFSLTDKRFSKIDKFMADTLFDENIGGKYGNSHIAIGASYSDTYKGNPKNLTKTLKSQLGFNDSALHWDLVNTEDKVVTVTLKGGKQKVIYEKGMFTY